MSHPILILPPRYTQDSIALWRAAGQLGWQTVRLPNWRVPEELRGQDVCIYGEPLFATVVAQELGLELIEPPDNWLVTLPSEFLNRRVEFSAYGQLHHANLPAFIKPAGEKSFEARVYEQAVDLPAPDFLPPETSILISEVVQWEVEYRCFVLNNEVRTLSAYWRNGNTTQLEDGSWPIDTEESADVMAFTRDVLSTMDPINAVVVDVGRICGSGWAVVEVNPAYGSGIYGCDPEEVLQVIRACCGKSSS